MIFEVNWPNVLANGSVILGSVSVNVYLLKKWMNTRETAEINLRKEMINTTTKITEDLSAKHKEATEEIKDKIAENKTFYSISYDKIEKGIDRLVEQQRIANGRTGKLEGIVKTQIALCKERNQGRRITDKCSSLVELEKELEVL